MRLIESAQNANMKPGVVGGFLGGLEKLSPTLCSFEPQAVLQKYQSKGPQAILEDVQRLKPHHPIRQEARSIWPQFCRSILSGAAFLSQFESAADFYEWADSFAQDDRSRPALPLLVEQEVTGFGFALACDFLKELGYVQFPKPDVQLRKIFTALELCPIAPTDLELFRAIIRLADNAQVTPYNADKLFWLIGSGFFYMHPEIERKRSLYPNFLVFAQTSLPKTKKYPLSLVSPDPNKVTKSKRVSRKSVF